MLVYQRVYIYIWIYCIILHLYQFLDAFTTAMPRGHFLETASARPSCSACKPWEHEDDMWRQKMVAYGHPATGWWYTYPSEKYESQLGWWHSQYMESHKSHVPNHQPGHTRPLLGSENGDIHPYWRDDHPLFTVTNQPKIWNAPTRTFLSPKLVDHPSPSETQIDPLVSDFFAHPWGSQLARHVLVTHQPHVERPKLDGMTSGISVIRGWWW